MLACYLPCWVGPVLHVRKFGPHVHQRGEYGLPQLTWTPPTQFQQHHVTWDFPHVTLPSLLLIRHLLPLYPIRACHLCLLTFSRQSNLWPSIPRYFIFFYIFIWEAKQKSIKIFSVVTVFKVFGLDASCGGGAHIW